MNKIEPLFDDALPYYKQFIQEVGQFLENENVQLPHLEKERITSETLSGILNRFRWDNV